MAPGAVRAKIVVPVLARLLPVSDVSVTITPLRFSTSDSRSESNDSVEEIEGKATCVCVRGRLVDGGLDRGRGSECCGGVIEVRGDDEGVDAGVTGEYERRGGGGSGYERCEISIGRLRRKNKCAEKSAVVSQAKRQIQQFCTTGDLDTFVAL